MQYNRANVKRILISSVLILTVLVIALPVGAQTGTMLAVDPAQGNLALAGTTQIRLLVIDGVDINAFDISIEYDANLLSLASWSFGDYLSNLAVVYKVDQPGTFRLACTQLATAAVSGNGILLNIVFRGENLGTSAITIIKADLAHSQGNLTHPSVLNGVLTVINEPTATATTTLTPQPTATYTPATSSTPVNTPTKSPTMTYTPTRTFTSGVETPIPSKTQDPLAVTTPTEVVPVDETGEVQQTPAVATEESEVDNGETGTQENPEPGLTLVTNNGVDDQPIPPDGNSGSNIVFWLLLIGGIILLAVLVYLVIRNKQKEKHKLIEY